MLKLLMIKSILLALTCSICLIASAVADPKQFDIPAGDLPAALEALTQQAAINLIYQPDQLRSFHTKGLKGTYEPKDAIRLLLKGTPFELRVDSSGAMVIAPARANATSNAGASIHNRGEEGKRNSSAGFRVAQAAVGAAGTSSQGAKQFGTLEEVIVTALKRAEPLREVADSVTAFTGRDLETFGAQSFEDYIDRAPGVQFQAATPGVSNVTIRGVGTATVNPDQGQATTGIYLNDIPLTDPSFAVSVPDLDVFDMQRVEVLRGPQGTLFGTATLGGAVNYITNPVLLDRVDADVQTGVSKTVNARDVGYTAKIAVNVPLIDDVFGIRMTAIKGYDPGFLDNIGTGRDDSNYREVEDYRVNVLWKINDQMDLSFLTFYDRSFNGDGFYAFPQLGNLVRDTFIPEYGSFITRINSLKFDTNLEFATLTVQGSDLRKSQDSDAVFTALYGGVPTSGPTHPRTHSDTVEARMTSPNNEVLEWLFGTYYGHFDESYPTSFLQDGVEVFYFRVGYKSNELSEFGEVTYHFSRRWRATVGGRYYDMRLATDTIQGAPPTLAENGGDQRGTGFSPKTSLTYEPNKDLVVYALVSKGFRMGGVNLAAPLPGFPTPATYRSDSLVNYELGIRPAWLDHTLTLDTAFFYIDWSDIQLRLTRPDGRDYVANAGAAHNKGIEGTLAWTPNPNWALHANLTYLEAALAQSIALGGGTTLSDGASLPGASKWTSSETARYTWSTNLAPFLIASHRFVSKATSNFTDTLPIGNYNIFDIRGGAHLGHNVTATLYVDNVADKRGVTASTLSSSFPSGPVDYYIRPRTVGLQFDWNL